MPVLARTFKQVGLNNAQDVDFVCSGSCDYLQGAAFAFVAGVDALGAVPPIKESHVEMDAAWALYESILKIRMGHADSALIYGFGKSSPGELPIVLSQQLDPYYLAPLWVDSISLAALQARLMLDAGLITERDMAEVVSRSRRNAMSNPHAQLSGDVSAEDVLAEPTYVSPLRKARLLPGVRRRQRGDHRHGRAGERVGRALRDHQRHRPLYRNPQPGYARPHRFRVHAQRGEARGYESGQGGCGGAVRAVQSPGNHPHPRPGPG